MLKDNIHICITIEWPNSWSTDRTICVAGKMWKRHTSPMRTRIRKFVKEADFLATKDKDATLAGLTAQVVRALLASTADVVEHPELVAITCEGDSVVDGDTNAE